MSEAPFSDRTKPTTMTNRNIILLGRAYDIEVTTTEMAMMRIPNGVKSLSAYAWMDKTFRLIGDVQPNKEDEIHLESMSKPTRTFTHATVYLSYIGKVEIYNEFKEDCELYGTELLDYSSFLDLWQRCFPHVLVRVVASQASTGIGGTTVKTAEDGVIAAQDGV